LRLIANIPKDKIAYIDETGIDTYLYREHCYAPKGQKVIGHISGKKYHRVGIVAAKLGRRILAPLQYDGTMDSFLFETWFEQRLLPDLPTNSVIVMDNAAFHRKKLLISLAENRGHTIIFLPPYSPELNPIENFWAWLKAKLRKHLSDFNDFDDALCYTFKVV
jgi:Transposase and inactivated derivatives